MSDRARVDVSNAVAKLMEENDTLRERVRQLMTELGETQAPLPREWQLTRTEEALMRALIAREVASRDFIMHFLYCVKPEDAPEPKIIDVLVCRLRPKLKPFGIEIATVWGRGYSLDATTRARFPAKQPAQTEHAARIG